MEKELVISIFIGLSLCLMVACTEPKCSKFDYEERLLEKMIKMEFNVEKVLDEMKTTQVDVKSELVTLRKERDSLKEEIAHSKKHLEKMNEKNLASFEEMKVRCSYFSAFSGIIRRISEYDSPFLKKICKRKCTYSLCDVKNIVYEDALCTLGIKLENGENQLSGPRVEFRARGIVDTTPTDGQVMVFSKVGFNQGQGYDARTGYFTAPTAGTYLLMTQICIEPTNYFYFEIVVEDVIQNAFQASAYSFNYCVSWLSISNMEVGARAWLKSKRTMSSNVFQTDDKHWNFFSGVLINKY